MRQITEAQEDLPLESLILHAKLDKYKLSYAAIRWAKEIKQKENLPDPVPTLVPRAIREILSGQKTIEDIEKLPMIVRVATPAPQIPTTPTITLNMAPDEPSEPAKEE